MPTYDQLDNEAAWRAEIAAPAIQTLGLMLRLHWPGAQIGIRGDNEHLRGYHRSRRWIKESAFCTNRTYSVSRTAGDRTGGDSNWACALDFGGVSQSDLQAACRRLDAAVRAGCLEKITEWYGNLGGDDRVDGWDNIADRIATADSSHLFHLHMSFDRGRANEDHSDVLAVLTGDDMFEKTDADRLWNLQQYVDALVRNAPSVTGLLGDPTGNGTRPNLVHEALAKLSAPILTDEQLAKIAAMLPKPPTEAELEAAAERAVRKVLGSLDRPPVL